MASAASNAHAKSLTSINHIAANPPQYPNNPTHKYEPLVLYISRVPGSRDIILSTQRPRRKIVTGQDVANSLYYVHLDHPSDALLIPPDQPRKSPVASENVSQLPRNVVGSIVRRKPLPATAKAGSGPDTSHRSSPTPTRPGQPDVSHLHPSDGDRDPPPVPLTQGGLHQVMGYEGTKQTVSQSLPGPRIRSQTATFESFLPPSSMRAASPPAPDAPSCDEISSEHRSQPTTSSPAAAQRRVYQPPPVLSSRPDVNTWAVTAPQSFSLTLIRRDPSAGSQSNVGKIFSQIPNSTTMPRLSPDQALAKFPQLANRLIHDTSRISSSGQPFTVRLKTSGYAKFGEFPGQDAAEARQLIHAVTPREPEQQQADAARIFERHIVMSYTKGVRVGLMEKLHGRTTRARSNTDLSIVARRPSHNGGTAATRRDRPESNVFDAQGVRPPCESGTHETPGARRSSSRSASPQRSASSSSTETGMAATSLVTHPIPGYHPAGYVFLTPWASRCEFRTKNGGRSLELRHILPEPAMLNTADQSEAQKRPPSSPVVTVSELKFNLPSPDLFAPGSKKAKIARDAQDRFNKYILKQSGWFESGTSDDSDEFDRDLAASIGTEAAGGGNRGSRVKMGKLIIHDEGMKMLDLVVAANVGIWWSAWERICE